MFKLQQRSLSATGERSSQNDSQICDLESTAKESGTVNSCGSTVGTVDECLEIDIKSRDFRAGKDRLLIETGATVNLISIKASHPDAMIDTQDQRN